VKCQRNTPSGNEKVIFVHARHRHMETPLKEIAPTRPVL
jgi:hypothetical protein